MVIGDTHKKHLNIEQILVHLITRYLTQIGVIQHRQICKMTPQGVFPQQTCLVVQNVQVKLCFEKCCIKIHFREKCFLG